MLSILHWRCRLASEWLHTLLETEDLLSILHWRCQWTSTLAVADPCATFNTPLEMLMIVVDGVEVGKCVTFNTPLEMRPPTDAGDAGDICQAQLSILHWRCRGILSLMERELRSFQYSIGDARGPPPLGGGGVHADLSILHWRCYA